MSEQQVVAAAMAKANSAGLANLSKAYVAAWAEIGTGVAKDANNPHFGNDYATLEAVEKVVKPALAKHGLAFLQTPGPIDAVGNIEIVGLLVHESGEILPLRMNIPLGGKATAQSAGSAITYGRRYQLMAVFGLAPTDDDGQAASEPPPKATKSTPRAKADDAEESGGYAARRDQLIADIKGFDGTADQLSETIKPRVEEMADAEVNAVYVARRRALTKGKK